MALYFYQALSKEGKKVSGHLDAATVEQVREQLTKKGMYPTTIKLSTPEATQSWWRRLLARGITTKDKILLTKQLAVLLKSGVPLLQSLEILIEYFRGKFQTILVNVKDDIKEGSSLAAALGKYPKVFDNIYVQVVKAGEASGKLDTILDHLTKFLERREVLRKKVKGAMRQPLIQLTVAAGVVGLLLYKVVPSMAAIFAASKKELPLPTKILMTISNFFVSNIIWILLGLALVIGAFLYWRSTPSGALTIDRIKLKLPLIKYFARTNAIVQFSQTLGMLLKSGVNLAEALDIVVNIVDNRVLANALSKARDKIVKEGKITQYLKQTGIFPPMATYLINTGEQSGELDNMLLTVAANYEEDLTELSDSLTEKLGPLMMIVVAAIVGFIVLAIALAMVEMTDVSAMG